MKGPHDLELNRIVAGLRGSIHPERDLWPDIEVRIVALRGPCSLGVRRGKFAVTAAVALAAVAAVSVLIMLSSCGCTENSDQATKVSHAIMAPSAAGNVQPAMPRLARMESPGTNVVTNMSGSCKQGRSTTTMTRPSAACSVGRAPSSKPVATAARRVRAMGARSRFASGAPRIRGAPLAGMRSTGGRASQQREVMRQAVGARHHLDGNSRLTSDQADWGAAAADC
jgi:hypothetical protein